MLYIDISILIFLALFTCVWFVSLKKSVNGEKILNIADLLFLSAGRAAAFTSVSTAIMFSLATIYTSL